MSGWARRPGFPAAYAILRVVDGEDARPVSVLRPDAPGIVHSSTTRTSPSETAWPS